MKILNKICVIFVTCLFILLSSQIAIAATYYIDYVSGLDSNNGTSTSTPWKHMPGMSGWTGSATLSSGDVVVLKGGVTWTFIDTVYDLLTVGTANVTVMGGQQCGFTGSPYVKCDGSTTPCGSDASVSCNGGVAWGTGYPVLNGTGSTASRGGIQVTSVNNVTIDGIKVVNIEYVTGGGDGTGNGVGFSGSSNTFKNGYLDKDGVNSFAYGNTGNQAHIKFHDNIVSNSGRLNVIISPSTTFDDLEFYNNTFYGEGTWTSGAFHGDGLMIGMDDTTANNQNFTNILIHHNKFLGNWSTGATALIYLNYYGGKGVYIYDNQIAIDSDGKISPALVSINDNSVTDWTNIYIYNNTFGAYWNAYDVVTCIRNGWSSTTSHLATAPMIVKNNILTGCSLYGIMAGGMSPSTGLSADYNLYYGPTRYIQEIGHIGDQSLQNTTDLHNAGFEAHGIVGSDPLFVTAPNGTTGHGNWQLQAGSPAINAGVDLSTSFTTDLLGNARPTGAGTWDIGAYEYPTSVTKTSAVTKEALAAVPANSSASNDGGKGRCFIATAAYGSYLDPHVYILRNFRDHYLLTNYFGKKVVEFYYRNSPPVAKVIAANDFLKTATRLALTPVVFSLGYPNVTLVLLLIALLI